MRKTLQALSVFVLSLLVIFLIPMAFGSIYETYDDLKMRASIEGKLFNTNPSSDLVFIKVILSKFIFSLPSQNLVPYSNYDIVQFFLVGISLGLIVYMLYEEKMSIFNFLTIISGLICVTTTFIIQPQFTNTAGLLGIASIVSLRKYFLTKNIGSLILFLIFFTLSFWMRSEIALVIFVIGLVTLFEFLYQNKLRLFLLPIAGALLSITLTLVIEQYAKIHDPNISANRLKRQTIAKFYDYNLGKKLLKPTNADLIKNSVFSENDIKLFHEKFFDWPRFDTIVPHINGIAQEYHAKRDYLSSRIKSSLYPFKYLYSSLLVFLLLPVIILLVTDFFFVAQPISRLSTLGVILVLIVYILYLGFIQRYGLTRIYVTPFLLIIVLTLFKLAKDNQAKWIYTIVASLLLTYSIGVYVNYSARLKDSLQKKNIFNELIVKTNQKNVVFYNAAFDLSLLYPVYPQNHKNVRFIGVDIINEEQSVVKRLLNYEQMIFVSGKSHLVLLNTFFEEHYNSSIGFKLIDKKLQLYSVKLNNKSEQL